MNDLRDLFKLAFRNIARNRRRSLLAGTTIALGVAALLFARAYIDGLQVLIREYVIEARFGALQVQREGYGASQDLAPLDLDLPADGDLVARLAADPQVAAVAPRIRFMGALSLGDASTMVMATAIDPVVDARVCPRGPGQRAQGEVNGAGLVAGKAFEAAAEDEAVLAVDLAAAMKAKVGDTVTLVVRTQKGSTDAVDLTISGIYRYSDPTENKHALVVPLAVAQRVLHMPDRATALVIGLRDNGGLGASRRALQATLGGQPTPTEVHTWEDLAPFYRDVITLQNDVLGVVVIIVFILVVASVVNTMLMSVFERTREVGTLMAIGFRRRRILALFLLESTLLSALASLIGAALGVVLVTWMHHRGLPFKIPAIGEILNRPVLNPNYIVIGCVGACASGIVGGLLPALRASRLRPIEALRAF